MTVEYCVSEYHWARYNYVLARRSGDFRTRRYYYFLVAWPVVWIGLGAFSAFTALSNGGSLIFLLIGFIFIVSMLKNLFKIKSYNRAIEESYLPRFPDREQIKVRLEISKTGISERQGDVVLSARWPDIVSISLEEDLLIISLRGLRKVIIPRSSFGFSDIDLKEVRNAIEQLRNTEGRTEFIQNRAENANGCHDGPPR